MVRRTLIITACSSILVATVAVAATRITREVADSQDADALAAETDGALAPEQSAEKPMVVRTTVATPTSISDTVTATGTTEAIREVTFSSEIPGKIAAMRAKLGDTVRRGQVLALIDHDALAAEQERAEAAFDLAKTTHERFVSLGDGVVSLQQIDETRSAMKTAEAGLTIAKNNVSKGVVRSNLTGVVTAKHKEKAEYTVPGAPLYHIVDYATIVVEAQLPEKLISKVAKGSEVSVRVDALDATYTGTVQAVLPVADTASHTFTVRVEIDNPKREILVGMSATLHIATGTERDVIVVPQDTVIEDRTGRSVFVARGDTAVKIPVTLGATHRDQVVITSGIEAGDAVITLGHRRLEEGERIEIAL